MRAARRRDPEATRLAILDAAEVIFVEKGLAAASMSDIAARAAVTKSLIHHHFGSKEELWLEIKRRSVEEYVKAQRAIMSSAAADRDTLMESLRVYFGFLERNPNFVRLSTWMNLEDPKLSAPTNPDLLQRGVERLRKAQASGADNKIGSRMKIDLDVHLRESDNKTILSFTAGVDVLGKLAALGHGIIKRKADQVLDEFAQAVKKKLEGES